MNGGNPPRVRRSWPWRYRRVLFLGALLGFSAVAGAVFVLTRVPLPNESRQAQTSFLTDATGAPLATLAGGEHRVPVAIDRVPPVVVDAVVATEDRSFFTHGGVDPIGIARATLADLRNQGSVQGGSTITQQYVKNIYVGHERTLWRKLKEAALAVKIERKYAKRQILERYLNTIYFGRGAYGVEAAAQAYFGKDVDALQLHEAAYLAGLIRSPQSADAKRNLPVAVARRALSLDAMVRARRITADQRATVESLPLDSYVIPAPAIDTADVAAADKGTQYFVDHVRRQLLDRYGEAEVYSGGLRVRTTLDLKLQAMAYDAVYGYLRPQEPAGALVAIDDQGQVKAMVGGRDWSVSKVNLALGREGGGTGRQAGSTFKPFLLAESVKEGFSVGSTLPGPAKVVIPKADNGNDWTVTNYENEDAGPSVSLVEATARSVNTVYAQLETAIGPAKLVDAAHLLGVASPLVPNASLVLGTESVSVQEMAAAYSTFANRGVRVDGDADSHGPASILEVSTADGTVLYRDRSLRTKVLERDQADVVNFCLRQVVEKGTGTGARFTGPGRVAGKTGTTDDYGDAWFVGYTPKLTAAVWMGWADGSSRKMNDVRGLKINGGSLPATIWRRFMEQATRDTDAGTFPDVSAFPGRAVVGVRAILPSTTTSSTPTTSTSVPGQPATTVPSTPSTPSTTAPTTPTTTRPSTSTTEVTAPVTTTTKVAPAGQRGPPGGLAP